VAPWCALCDTAVVSDGTPGGSDDLAGREIYGTAAADAPVPRSDVERGFRALNILIADLRDDLHRLAAQVVTLTEEVARRIEPDGAADGLGLEQAVDSGTPATFDKIQAATEHANSMNRLHLHVLDDKYAVTQDDGPPCAELLPICLGRCCRLMFALSTQDLDEGVIRWDYGRPYMIRQRASDGYCVHNDPDRHGCTAYQHRPSVCRRYDCRQDARVWEDYERRIPAPLQATSPLTPDDGVKRERPAPDMEMLAYKAHTRQIALTYESMAVHDTYSDVAPARGVEAATAAFTGDRRPR
jgi:Fe-S-cluster containining protein